MALVVGGVASANFGLPSLSNIESGKAILAADIVLLVNSLTALDQRYKSYFFQVSCFILRECFYTSQALFRVEQILYMQVQLLPKDA